MNGSSDRFQGKPGSKRLGVVEPYHRAGQCHALQIEPLRLRHGGTDPLNIAIGPGPGRGMRRRGRPSLCNLRNPSNGTVRPPSAWFMAGQPCRTGRRGKAWWIIKHTSWSAVRFCPVDILETAGYLLRQRIDGRAELAAKWICTGRRGAGLVLRESKLAASEILVGVEDALLYHVSVHRLDEMCK